ncbi:hypothetical protein Tco_0324090 [Tanacetum coccineum]
MANLKFTDTHNMVAFLSKPAESEGFEQIATFKAKTFNGEVQLQALVDGKKIIITESIIRRDLQIEDADGVDYLPNAIIFEQLTLMGSKTTGWNKFSSTMTSAIICLAINQKFNFSKYIFESMVKNLDNVSGNFLMYPRGGKGFSGRETPLFQTMTVQDQEEVGEDEAVNEEMDDSLERAATTATGIDVEQDKVIVSPVLSWRLRPPPELVPRELGSLGVALDWVLLMLPLFCSASKLEAVVAALTKLSSISSLTTSSATFVKILSLPFSYSQIEQESSKKQKLEEDKESEELKQCLEIIPDDGDDVTIDATPLSTKSPTIVDYKIYKEGKKSYFQIIRADGKTQMYLTFGKMLKNFNREDLEVLWSIVKARFKKTEPVNYMDNFLLLNLKTMFEHHVEDNVWKNQQGLVKVLNWKLYDSCGVHCVTMQNMLFYLLVEKMYPLTNHTLHHMFNYVKLQVDYECEMEFELLRLINIKFRGGLLGLKVFVRIKSFIRLFGITTALIKVRVAQEERVNAAGTKLQLLRETTANG